MTFALRRAGALATMLMMGTILQSAHAAEDVYVSGGFHVDLGIELGVGAFASPNSNFGLGRIDLVSGDNTGDAEWLEGYARPSLGLRYDIDANTLISGYVSGVLAVTSPDGDVGGYTSDGTDADLDQAYLSLSTKLNGGTDADGFDLAISGGRQKVQIGDGFLMYGGNFDTGNDQTFWLAPRQAFDLAGTVKLESKTLGLTGFAVESDKDTARTQMIGVDLTYSGDWGGVGLLGAHILDDNGSIPREGMDMISVRAKDVKVPVVENLTVSGEFAYQFGDGNGIDFDAYGYYGDIAYKFADIPWQPTLTYRYAAFSGDRDPTDNTVKSFDPLFYGFSGWGSWFMGEVVGEYMLFNSNQTTHMVKLSVTPAEGVGAGLLLYHFELDEKNYFGTPVSGRNFADEINAYAEWTVNDHLYVAGVAGFALPNKAAKEVFGDETNWIFEVYATYTY